jgi:hypothetical protein
MLLCCVITRRYRTECTLGLRGERRLTCWYRQKPGGIAFVKKHFGEVDPETLVVIGDRYSTDVLFGNLNGEWLDRLPLTWYA